MSKKAIYKSRTKKLAFWIGDHIFFLHFGKDVYQKSSGKQCRHSLKVNKVCTKRIVNVCSVTLYPLNMSLYTNENDTYIYHLNFSQNFTQVCLSKGCSFGRSKGFANRRANTHAFPFLLTYSIEMWEGILQEASLPSLTLVSLSLYFKAIFQMPDAQLDLMDSIPLRAKEGGKQSAYPKSSHSSHSSQKFPLY